jgi:hypothetical protein
LLEQINDVKESQETMIKCQKEGKDILELPEYIQNMYQKWKESCKEAIISSKHLLLSQIRLIIVAA